MGIIVIFLIVIRFFNISLTALPTTFKEMVEDQIDQDEVLVMPNLDVDRIDKIRIEHPQKGSSSHPENTVIIEDKEIISTLLTNGLRIYNGGRFNASNDEYDLYVDYYGSTHRYTFAEEYIRTMGGNYIVLDANNELYNDVVSLYEEN